MSIKKYTTDGKVQHYTVTEDDINTKLGNIIGDKFPKDIFDSTPLDKLYKYKIKGDKWGFQKTAIRKKYSFPILVDDVYKSTIRFYPEIAIFGEIGKIYRTRYINKPLKIVEYHDTGLSKSKTTHAYAKKISAIYRLNYCLSYFRYAPIQFFISALLYGRWSFHSNSFNLSEINTILGKFLVLVTLPFAYSLYYFERNSS